MSSIKLPVDRCKDSLYGVMLFPRNKNYASSPKHACGIHSTEHQTKYYQQIQRIRRKHIHDILYDHKSYLHYDNKEMRLYNKVEANT